MPTKVKKFKVKKEEEPVITPKDLIGSYVNKANNTTMDDGNFSNTKIQIVDRISDANFVKNRANIITKELKRSFGLIDRSDIDLFTKRYRFGILNPYEKVSTTKEYLFFTKPDLNIYSRNDKTGAIDGKGLVTGLKDLPFWKEMSVRYDNVISCLQSSYGNKEDRFNHLLENSCKGELSVPGLDAETIDTPNNIYGVGFSYRGSSEASNDSFEFDLEFEDTQYLLIYHFFKMYEEYETLKHHGTVEPWLGYIVNKIIHDQFSIYKFLVGEDGETIIYYCKYCGVMPKSLPRDVFSSQDFDNGLSYSINFKAAFFEDMDPLILNEFNALNETYFMKKKYEIGLYNDVTNRVDYRPAQSAYVVSDETDYKYSNITKTRAPGGIVYKLKWRGDDFR